VTRLGRGVGIRRAGGLPPECEGPAAPVADFPTALIAATPEGAEKKHMKMDGVSASGFGVGAQRPPGGPTNAAVAQF